MLSGFARHFSKCCHLQGRRLVIDVDSSTKYSLLANQQRWRAYVPSHHQFGTIRSHRISHHGFILYPRSSFSSSSAPSSRSKLGFLGWYLGVLESRPLVTKSVTTSLIYIASDLTAQIVTLSSASSLDSVRTVRMAAYGLLILGPTQHLWFNFVSKILPKRDVVTTLKKIFMGQAIYGPCIAAVFFSFNAGLQGESRSEIVARLKRDLLPTLINGLAYWPFCDFITFKYVPVHLQKGKKMREKTIYRKQLQIGLLTIGT
ncbi:uncharacterized protein LOC131161590 isoform X2 [Malania oleifera]|uniref:uncharacterized protein LOC131161590 isoform X2 n=1 Tax=Malania oleifera TaxID=397392 RepID=UPI0025AE37C6|nr:uncharacterized protein LOC131161590 isoform X2 [Malania oleifera]